MRASGWSSSRRSGWWDGGDIAGGYYPARDAAGAAVWVFRDRRGEWYLHGVFG